MERKMEEINTEVSTSGNERVIMVSKLKKPNMLAIGIVLVSITLIPTIFFIIGFCFSWSLITWLLPLIVVLWFVAFVFGKRYDDKLQKYERYADMMGGYQYDYDGEYEIYKRIGKKHKDKIHLKIEEMGINIPKCYSEWKAYLKNKYDSINDNEDFYHFMKYEYNIDKASRNGVFSIIIPINVLVITAFATVFSQNPTIIIPVGISIVFLLCLIAKETEFEKLEYSKDVMKILCEKQVKEDKFD